MVRVFLEPEFSVGEAKKGGWGSLLSLHFQEMGPTGVVVLFNKKNKSQRGITEGEDLGGSFGLYWKKLG